MHTKIFLNFVENNANWPSFWFVLPFRFVFPKSNILLYSDGTKAYLFIHPFIFNVHQSMVTMYGFLKFTNVCGHLK